MLGSKLHDKLKLAHVNSANSAPRSTHDGWIDDFVDEGADHASMINLAF